MAAGPYAPCGVGMAYELMNRSCDQGGNCVKLGGWCFMLDTRLLNSTFTFFFFFFLLWNTIGRWAWPLWNTIDEHCGTPHIPHRQLAYTLMWPSVSQTLQESQKWLPLSAMSSIAGGRSIRWWSPMAWKSCSSCHPSSLVAEHGCFIALLFDSSRSRLSGCGRSRPSPELTCLWRRELYFHS